MKSRLTLQTELENLIGKRKDGKQNVYFQPPESVKLYYPCIIYKESTTDVRPADNTNYLMHGEYLVTIVEKDPDSDLKLKLLNGFKHIRHSRTYTADNLYHRVFTLYY